MAVSASDFEHLITTGGTTHVHDVEQKIDRMLDNKVVAHLAILNNKEQEKATSVRLNVYAQITEEEIKDLEQLYVDAGWRNVRIAQMNTLGTRGILSGFVFEANFA